MDNCWAENYCKKVKKPGCDQYCPGYVILEVLYHQSGIPLRYQYPQQLSFAGPDEHIYEFVSNLLSKGVTDWVKAGNNLLFWSENKGNGKTSLACAIANKYIRECAPYSDLEPVVCFIKTAKFLEDLRQQFNSPTYDFPEFLKKIERVPLLIIDDIGAERATEWVRERLLSIIDERYSNNRSTIYTSNCSLTEISEHLHSRIADRLKDAQMFQFQSQSWRGIK